MIAKKILITANLITVHLTGAAAALECPREIPAQSIHLTDIPNDWTQYIASPLYLHSAGLAGGTPDKLTALVGASQGQPGDKEWSTTYKLEGPYPSGKWLECGYGERNQVILSKRLNDNTQECKVTYRRGEKAGQNQLGIACK